MKTNKLIQRISETKGWFFEKINKIDKTLDKLTKRMSNNTKINKIREEAENIAIDTEKIQRTIRTCLENLYSTELENS